MTMIDVRGLLDRLSELEAWGNEPHESEAETVARERLQGAADKLRGLSVRLAGFEKAGVLLAKQAEEATEELKDLTDPDDILDACERITRANVVAKEVAAWQRYLRGAIDSARASLAETASQIERQWMSGLDRALAPLQARYDMIAGAPGVPATLKEPDLVPLREEMAKVRAAFAARGERLAVIKSAAIGR
jgi:hypothetical protein